MSTIPAELARLHDIAVAARRNAYAPYSHFAVGAALLADDGQLYAGANVENAAYPVGLCAEAAAIAAMIAAGARGIRAILIVAEGIEPCSPCGSCRQRIREFSTRDTLVHLCDTKTLRASHTIEALLPLSFGAQHLPE